MAEERARRRREKQKREDAHVARMLARGLHPVEVADELISHLVRALEAGVRHRHPNASDEEVKTELREIVRRYYQHKNARRRPPNGGA
ncbi:MAG: hypothetical protein Kow0069_39500 [Promethearchaeota archaeon]